MSDFTNSALAAIRNTNHKKINGSDKNTKRTRQITKITIHHTAGVINGAPLLGWGHNPKCGASWNYGIGNDGIIGLMTEERHRAWTSSNATNDYQAVTIEVGNSGGKEEGWPVGEKAYNALLDLCTDICRRNGIARLTFDGTKNGSLTHHSMFASTSCPGKYLLDRFPQICEEVNKRLGKVEPGPIKIEAGSLVRFKPPIWNYHPSGPAFPAFVKTGTHVVTKVKDASGKEVIRGNVPCVLLGKRIDPVTGKQIDGVNTWAAADYLDVLPAATVPATVPAAATTVAEDAAMDDVA